jgi:hypothetical protein
MNTLRKIFVVLICVSVSYASDDPLLTRDPYRIVYNNSLLIASRTNSTLCRMDKEYCELYFLLHNDVATSEILFSSNDEKIFKYTSIEPCKDNFHYVDSHLVNENNCLKLNEFGLSEDLLARINVSDYSIHKVKIKAQLIGNATLSMNVTKPQLSERLPSLSELIFYHRVVVSAPRRKIDIIFDIWTWTFGALISLRKKRKNMNNL